MPAPWGRGTPSMSILDAVVVVKAFECLDVTLPRGFIDPLNGLQDFVFQIVIRISQNASPYLADYLANFGDYYRILLQLPL